MKKPKFLIVIVIFIILLFFFKNKKIITGETIEDKEVIRILSEERLDISDLKIPSFVRILALGEHTHGSRIDQRIKIEIYKKAIENGFFTILAETDYASGKMVDDYIKSKNSYSSKYVVSHLICPSYRSKDFIEFMDFLKEYNLQNNNVITFIGYDIQNYEANLMYCIDKLLDIDVYTKEKIKLLSSKEEYTDLLNELKIILNSEDENLESKYLLKNIINGIKYTEVTNEDESFYYREKYNYENIKDLSINRKVFLIAHNGHVIKDNFLHGEIPSTGKLLSEEFNKEYYTILPFAYEDNIKIRKIINTHIWYFVNLKVINNNNFLLFNNSKLPFNTSLYVFNEIDSSSVFSKERDYFCIGDGYNYNSQIKNFYYEGNITNATDALIIINREERIKKIFNYTSIY